MRLQLLLPSLILSLIRAVKEDSIYAGNPCYDQYKTPQRCVPEFVNAAYNVKVDVTNTCGEHHPTEYCVQTGASGARKTCEVCDSKVHHFKHSAEYLTDFNDKDNATWWQSETMAEGINYPSYASYVNLTLKLGKAFDISYVRLKFVSPRPESFGIFKKTREDSPWTAWQFYSGSCRATYGVPDRAPILPGAETVAQCTNEYSDISPLTGADIAFSTRNNRPSAERFDKSDILQEWVTATEIRISLQRLNTFGDEVFGDPKVLRSYYYAISDFAVGGRCLCNGHASECVPSTGDGEKVMVCRCEHNTEGPDCEKCKPFYNDREWMRATAEDANECKPCNCSGLSNRCYFDKEMYRLTGSGGHCTECQSNTKGPHCEVCVENTYRREGDRGCTNCDCNLQGSMSLQCDPTGQCPCKPGVGGRLCDRCLPNYFEFSPQGCKPCGCVEAGSYGNSPSCRPETGECYCKANVEGKTCDRCKPGHFNLDLNNEYGCLACFCYGHSSLCESGPGYYEAVVESKFDIGNEGWKTDAQLPKISDAEHDQSEKVISVSGTRGPAYFIAPQKFLGNHRASYNKNLIFKLRVDQEGSRASVRDVIIEGAGQSVSVPIFAQQNPVPAPYEQEYKFRLHEDAQFQWNPRLSSLEFMKILSNITAIKIRGGYTAGGYGFLDDVRLESASMTEPQLNAKEAKHIETCKCPDQYTGQFCESCAPGFRREPKFGGAFGKCIECQCHKHSELCEAESGKCLCEHNTAGDQCEKCANGFYGNALAGTPNDCKPCPCPGQGRCHLHTDGDIVCLECPTGYAGRKCDICNEGFFGEPHKGIECKICDCNENIDPNSIGNCDRITGECKKCVYNTRGFHCEKCMGGFYGDALLKPKGDCKPCSCYKPGSFKPSRDYKVLECNQGSGQCECMPHVTGRTCDKCEPGYYNITSGTGCQACNCDPLGSLNSTCDVSTGQCHCKPGVTGKHCDMCINYFFGFGAEGCKACNCLAQGSTALQCDLQSGQCLCRDNIEGRECDRCVENMYNLEGGCFSCPPCYGLIQRRVKEHREKVQKLHALLEDIRNNPTVVEDTNFDLKLKEVQTAVDAVTETVRKGLAVDDSALVSEVKELRIKLDEASKLLRDVYKSISATNSTADTLLGQLKKWDDVKGRAYEKLRQAHEYLTIEGRKAWDEAQKASQSFGEQSEKLSEIAKEARELAAKHKAEAEKIVGFAENARNISLKAFKEAEDAVSGTEAASKEINALSQKYADAEERYNRTKAAAKEQLERAIEVHKLAAEAQNKANDLSVPELNTEELSKEAFDVLEEAKNAKQQAEKLTTENRAVLEEAHRVRGDAEYELNRLEQQQQIADRLLAELDAARSKALKAVELAESTLKEAKTTLQTFQEFDATVEESRTKADESLKNIDEIKRIIDAAEARTAEAERALGDASEDARHADEIAKQAQEVAEDASKSAMKVREDASKTRASAKSLKQDVESFQGTLDDATGMGQTLTNYKDLAAADKTTAHELLSTASQAEVAAQHANRSAEEALELVKKILDDLNNLESVKDEDLDKLDSELNASAETLTRVDLDNELKSLKEKQSAQQQRISNYKEQIERLSREVENIKQIREALPQQCFNVVHLEQDQRR